MPYVQQNGKHSRLSGSVNAAGVLLMLLMLWL